MSEGLPSPQRVRVLNEVVRRRYALDEDYFESIDSPVKAYWLGMLWADGYVNVHRGYGRICLSLQWKDRRTVLRFALAVGYDGLVHDVQTSTTRRLDVSFLSKKMFEDLGRLGIVPRKTFASEVVPDLLPELVPHFLRGLFDGDGTIYLHRWGGKVAITGTERTCFWVKDHVSYSLDVGGSVYRKKGCWVWEMSGRNQLLKFAEWLYLNANEFMERKKDKFLVGGLLDV